MTAINVEHLSKSFEIYPPEISKKFLRFLHPRKEILAVNDISFQVKEGERVAFVGPNGAGKSTTMKVLSGILAPTQGKVTVAGLEPWQDRKKLGYEVGTVFGQRSQLWQHLTAEDSFELLGKMYKQPFDKMMKRANELIDLFEVRHVISKPLNQLSLGEKMKCEIIASLLHQPKVLFLDEPTIGLDVTSKATIRDLVKKKSEEENVTLLLTSHDTGDIENVCDRIIIIHYGKILVDQSLKSLRSQYIRKKVITLVTAKDTFDVNLAGVKVLQHVPHRFVLEVNSGVIAIEKVIEFALKSSSLNDITVEDPPMEDIIKEIFTAAKSPKS